MADNRLFAATKVTTLASGAALGATSMTPTAIQDREGNSIATMATYFGTKGYGVISPGKDKEEHFTFTGISAGVLTGVSHITMVSPYTESSGLSEAHAAGEIVILMSNTPGFYNDFCNKQNDETIVGTYTFNELPTLDSYEAPTNSAQFAPKGYVDSVAMGTTTVDKLIVAGTAGETVAAGNLVYLKSADGFWWKTDADTASTVDNVILGIAQGAGTAGNAIASGVLLRGLDTNQSGMTIGAIQYASNTAGAISSSAGTTEVTVGQARTATNLYFLPRFNQNITEAQQDLLDGITSSSTEINTLDGYTGTVSDFNEMSAIVQATNITGAELETLSSSSTSNADSLHTHSWLETLSVTRNTYVTSWFDLSDTTRFPTATAGAATQTIRGAEVNYATGGTSTNGMTVETTTVPWNGAGVTTHWTKNQYLEATWAIDAVVSQDVFWGFGTAVVGSGTVVANATDTSRHYGFYIQDGTLYASNADGTTQTRTDVSSGITLTNYNCYKIVSTSANIKFYINNVLVATHTTNLPTGNTNYGFALGITTQENVAKTLFIDRYVVFGHSKS